MVPWAHEVRAFCEPHSTFGEEFHPNWIAEQEFHIVTVLLNCIALQIRRRNAGMTRLALEIACCIGAALSLSAVCMPAYAQEDGFLSIDCGNTSPPYTDNLGLMWVNDAPYGLTGNNGTVPFLVGSSVYNYQAAQTFRYFPNSRSKSCYELPTIGSTSYLIRAMFLHGNADGLVVPTIFEISVNATVVDTVSFVEGDNFDLQYTFEAIFPSLGNVVHFCLLPVSGVPFISSIEVRPLDPGGIMYSYRGSETQYLSNMFRWNCGAAPGASTVRYPDDAFDRLWATTGSFSIDIPVYTSSGGLNTTTGPEYNNVPAMVMKDAWTVNAPNETFSVLRRNIFKSVQYVYAAVYIQEIVPTSAVRGFTIAYNEEVDSIYAINATRTVNSVYYTNWDISSSQLTNFTFTGEPWSTLGPVVNAMEAYSKFDFNSSRTSENDVDALTSLQTSFNLTDWQGDPCLPVPWNWVACMDNSSGLFARVNKILLEDMGISGTIPANISRLDALTEIHLENNNLTGLIPESIADLPFLKVLLLQNNDLSGQVPTDLLNKASLTDFNYSGNTLLDASSLLTPTPASSPKAPTLTPP